MRVHQLALACELSLSVLSMIAPCTAEWRKSKARATMNHWSDLSRGMLMERQSKKSLLEARQKRPSVSEWGLQLG